MKIVTFFSFFICSCNSLGLFNVCSLYFCSFHALFCGSVFLSFFFRPWSISCPLASFLSVDKFTILQSLPWLPVLFIIFPVTHWPVPESVCLIQFWKTFFGRSVQYSPIVILPSCRSISFLPDYFLSFGLFPVLHSVSSLSVCYVFISQYHACLSASFSVGLFSVYRTVSYNSRYLFCPSVCFRTVGSVSCPSPDLPVSFPLVYFQFFRSVSSSSLSFKFIDMF